MSKKIQSILLVSIVCIAAFLRLYKLGIVPASPDWDEAALGYNAYSILKTGKDEYGQLLPVVFRSFNDFKPPLYIYTVIPFIAIFGLTIQAVRLPSVVFGIFAVIGTYFLAKELLQYLKDNSEEAREGKIFSIFPLLASFLLAISPWHLQFSRVAFEANLAVTLIIWGMWGALRALRGFIPFSFPAILFSLSLYAYHATRVFVPLMIMSLLVIFRKELSTRIKNIVLGTIIFLIVLLPLLSTFKDKSALARLGGTSIFRKQTEVLAQSTQYYNKDVESGSQLGIFLNNRRITWVTAVFSGYLSHFSPNWLFAIGDNPRHHAVDMGLLYIVQIPFLLAGLVCLFTKRSHLSYIVFSWILLAPVASSLTYEVPHAVRSIVFLPIPEILTAIGILYVFRIVSNIKGKPLWLTRNFQWIYICCAIVLFAINISYYLTMYYVFMDRNYASSWQYGYKEAVNYTELVKGLYDHVIVSEALEQPYIFYLFYTRYDPKKYLASGGSNMKNFGKYIFMDLNSGKKVTGKNLIVGKLSEISGAIHKYIYYPNRTPAFVFTEQEIREYQ